MKTVSSELNTHLAADCTALCTLLKITRRDGQVFAFTDHDAELVFSGVTYLPQFGFSRSATQANAEISANNADATLFVDDDSITSLDIRGKLFDGAEVLIQQVNWKDLTQGALKHIKGTLGQLKLDANIFTAPVNGLADLLSTVIGDTYGPTCRAQLGDAKCGIDMATFRQSGSVASSADAYTLTPAAGLKMTGSATPLADAPAGWFDDGILTFTSGANNGLSHQIRTWDATDLVFHNPMFAAPAAADTFTIEPGCNHSADPDTGDCQGKFDNILNFRGEPFMPLDDQVNDWPDVATEDEG